MVDCAHAERPHAKALQRLQLRLANMGMCAWGRLLSLGRLCAGLRSVCGFAAGMLASVSEYAEHAQAVWRGRENRGCRREVYHMEFRWGTLQVSS